MALRILLADDEKEFVDTLAERLTLRGYAPYVVYDGISALQAATPEKPDVVVLDLFMPGMSGEEVLAKLRADPRFNGLHIIAYTAHALPEEKQRLIDAGFDDLLIKPISLKAVELALANFLPA